jgi:hypothetical protein
MSVALPARTPQHRIVARDKSFGFGFVFVFDFFYHARSKVLSSVIGHSRVCGSKTTVQSSKAIVVVLGVVEASTGILVLKYPYNLSNASIKPRNIRHLSQELTFFLLISANS